MRSLAVVFAVAVVLSVAASVRAQNVPPACGVRTRSPPVLTRYDALTRGARFLVRLHYDTGSRSWTPSPQLRMPFHHASSIEYVGYTMPPPSTSDLELEVTGISHRLVRHEARINTWFVTYRVRVRSACTLPAPR